MIRPAVPRSPRTLVHILSCYDVFISPWIFSHMIGLTDGLVRPLLVIFCHLHAFLMSLDLIVAYAIRIPGHFTFCPACMLLVGQRYGEMSAADTGVCWLTAAVPRLINVVR